MYKNYLLKKFATANKNTKERNAKYLADQEAKQAKVNADNEKAAQERAAHDLEQEAWYKEHKDKTPQAYAQELQRRQQAKTDTIVWKDLNLFRSTPAFAQMGITEDMIKSNKVPSKNVAAALETLYRGISDNVKNGNVAPNKAQYDNAIYVARNNQKGPLSQYIIGYAAKKDKDELKEKKKQQNAHIKDVMADKGFSAANDKKTKNENIATLVKSMDVAYSNYIKAIKLGTDDIPEKEALCDNIFKSITHLVTNNETTKILVAEAIQNLYNGNTPAWLEESDMSAINELLKEEAADNVRRLRAQDVDVFENDSTLWKDKSTGQNIKIQQF